MTQEDVIRNYKAMIIDMTDSIVAIIMNQMMNIMILPAIIDADKGEHLAMETETIDAKTKETPRTQRTSISTSWWTHLK